MPSALHVTPMHAMAGTTVTLSSTPFTCAASSPRGKAYTLSLGQVGRATPVRLGVVRVKRNGAFATTVRLPVGASLGEA
jgi:hypothetical protein